MSEADRSVLPVSSTEVSLSQICSCKWDGDKHSQGIDCPVHKVDSATWCGKHQYKRDVESDCSTCHGEGMVEEDDPGMGHGYSTCWSCHGSGVSPWLDCEWCLEEDNDY